MVTRSQPEPLYSQTVDELKRKIDSGEWNAGEKIPSERDLAEQFDVSRITIRHAIRLAIDDGLLTRRHGVGTFVSDGRPLEQELSEIRSFADTLSEQGHVGMTRIVQSAAGPSDLTLASALGLSPAESVYNLRLVGLSDGAPVVYYDSYFPLAIGRILADRASRLEAEGEPFTSIDLYSQVEIGHRPGRISQTIEAAAATRTQSELLRIAVGTPVLVIESLIGSGSAVCEYRRAYYRSDWYKFVTERTLRHQA